jgi:hypothetical protein
MIRVLAGSAIAALAIGLAGSFVAPSLVGVPRGEPMLVAGADSASLLQPANFDEAACAARLLLAEGPPAEAIAGTAPLRIVALAVRAGPRGFALAIQELSAEAALPDGALVLALAPDGRIIGMWDRADFRSGAAGDALAAGCDQLQPDPPVGSV